MSDSIPFAASRARVGRAIGALGLAGLVALAVPAAQAQQSPELYQDKGFYQSYVFGVPSDPSEEWLLGYGGRLYDMWWAVLSVDPPEETHPAYPEGGRKAGADTWRCVECHGWDYRGRDGQYRAGPHYTGIKGIGGMRQADPARIAAIIRDDTHRYTADLVPDKALKALAYFVSRGQTEAARWIDGDTGRVRGDAERGRGLYQNVCAICHDYNGMAWITGNDELTTLGAVAQLNPWRGLHKVMNGQTYADMPAMRAFGLKSVLDILAYAQTLPRQ